MALTTRDYNVVTTITGGNITQCVNSWYFKAIDDLGNASDLWLALEDDYVPNLLPCLHVYAENMSTKVINLVDDADFHEATSVAFTGGIVAGEILAEWNAAMFRILRPNRSIRHGRKAISPIGEGELSNRLPTPTFLVHLADLALSFDGGITANLLPLSTYDLCIPRHTLIDEGLPTEHYEITELVVSQGMEFTRISHQVSRG